jgi:hypothetical protein
MGKKNQNLFPSRGFLQTDLTIFAACQVAYGLACYCYLLTLEGGDVDHLKGLAGWFAFLLLASTLIYGAVSAFVQWHFSHSLLLRLINWGLGGLWLWFTLTYDLGTTLEKHGQFNLMIYIILWAPIFIGYILVKLIKFLNHIIGNTK